MLPRKRSPIDGQSTLEYAVFIAVVSAALITMNDYVRRSIQANLKAVEDRINAEAFDPSTAPPDPDPGP